MNDITLIKSSIPLDKIREIASQRFGDMVKAVVDIEQGIMAAGAGMHADEEAYLLDRGSKQKDLWGINIYPDLQMPDMVEFDSMINIRPKQNNKSRNVEDEGIRKDIVKVVTMLIE
ncbi:MAG: DUF5674 family protein [Candidatus Andersenbacteria bacterium]